MGRIPTVLLKLVVQALISGRNDNPRNDAAVGVSPAAVADIWKQWASRTDEAQRREEIEALAQARWADLEQPVEEILAEIAVDRPAMHQPVTAYLLQIPAALRRRLNPPAKPAGQDLSTDWTPRQPADLLALLPQPMQWFTQGEPLVAEQPAAAARGTGREQPQQETGTEGRPAGRVRQRRSDVWEMFDTLEKKAPEVAKLLTNSLGLKMVLVPAGTFHMGTQWEESGARENEWPRHEVTLTKPFYLAATPVTQQQYLRVMGTNPARFNAENGGSPDHPVENVTWEQAEAFCRKLSELPEEKQAGRSYRLPTEAEWEYACRAGTDTPFSFGASLSSAQANFDGHFPAGGAAKGRMLEKTSRVGQFPPNNFGLFDLHGNVWEWCADWLDGTYYEWSPKRDPKGPGEGHYRVLRGGAWKNHAVTCRSGYRNALGPRLRDSATGFRVACDVPSVG